MLRTWQATVEDAERSRPYDLVILGAGLAGLSIATAYVRKHPGSRILLIERNDEVGGLARSYDVGGVCFDFGPHVLRGRDPEIVSRLSTRVPLLPFKTRPGSWKYGQMMEHVVPTVTQDNIRRLPEPVQRRITEELSRVGKDVENGHSFESALTSRIGLSLYWEFFGQYSEKWWGIRGNDLSVSLAPSNVSIGKEASYAHITTGFQSPAREFYPRRGGYRSIVYATLEDLRSSAGSSRVDLLLDSDVDRLEVEDGKVRYVYDHHGNAFVLDGRLISTIPLTTLSSTLKLRSDVRYRSDICVFVAASKETVRWPDRSWIYCPEDTIFSRLYSPGWFSPENEPGSLAGICAEITCFEDDETWGLTRSQLIQRTIEGLLKMGILEEDGVRVARVVREPHAYPLMTRDHLEKRSSTIKRIQAVASNIVPIGRTGGFVYWNSDAVLGLGRSGIPEGSS